MKKVITEERSFEKMFPLPARDMPTISKRTIMANLYPPYYFGIYNSKEINAISQLSGYKKLNGCT